MPYLIFESGMIHLSIVIRIRYYLVRWYIVSYEPENQLKVSITKNSSCVLFF